MTDVNIITPTPRRRPRSKTPQVFALINEHATSEYRKIHKDKLVIPLDTYQRDESEGKIANAIAQNYDLVALADLLVIQSSDGTLRVLDGGTRLSAARKRPDITHMQCKVFTGLTPEEEAETFLRINEHRRRLLVAQLQKAELAARYELAIKAEDYTDRLKAKRVGFDSLADLRRMIKSHGAATATVIDALSTAAVGFHVTARVFKGMVTLEMLLMKEDRTLKRKRTLERMRRDFDKIGMYVNATIITRTRADSRTLAAAVAKVLGLRVPRDAVS